MTSSSESHGTHEMNGRRKAKGKRPKPYRWEAFGILNPYGDIWTPDHFETEAAAREYIAHFWRENPEINLSEFRVINVHVVISAQEPTS